MRIAGSRPADLELLFLVVAHIEIHIIIQQTNHFTRNNNITKKQSCSELACGWAATRSAHDKLTHNIMVYYVILYYVILQYIIILCEPIVYVREHEPEISAQTATSFIKYARRSLVQRSNPERRAQPSGAFESLKGQKAEQGFGALKALELWRARQLPALELWRLKGRFGSGQARTPGPEAPNFELHSWVLRSACMRSDHATSITVLWLSFNIIRIIMIVSIATIITIAITITIIIIPISNYY